MSLLPTEVELLKRAAEAELRPETVVQRLDAAVSHGLKLLGDGPLADVAGVILKRFIEECAKHIGERPASTIAGEVRFEGFEKS